MITKKSAKEVINFDISTKFNKVHHESGKHEREGEADADKDTP